MPIGQSLIEKPKPKWNTELSLRELQNRLLPPPYNPIKLNDDIAPVHLNKDNKLLCKYEEKDFIPFKFNSNIKASNIGRIKYKDEFVDQFYLENEGIVFYTPERMERVHRIVAISWLGQNEGIYPFVHHINNNFFDNNENNLLMVTNAQHNMIHIKGTWIIGNNRIKFIDDKFLIERNNEPIINGSFDFEDIEYNNLRLILLFSKDVKIELSFKDSNSKKMKIVKCNDNEFTVLNGNWQRLDYV